MGSIGRTTVPIPNRRPTANKKKTGICLRDETTKAPAGSDEKRTFFCALGFVTRRGSQQLGRGGGDQPGDESISEGGTGDGRGPITAILLRFHWFEGGTQKTGDGKGKKRANVKRGQRCPIGSGDPPRFFRAAIDGRTEGPFPARRFRLRAVSRPDTRPRKIGQVDSKKKNNPARPRLKTEATRIRAGAQNTKESGPNGPGAHSANAHPRAPPKSTDFPALGGGGFHPGADEQHNLDLMIRTPPSGGRPRDWSKASEGGARRYFPWQQIGGRESRGVGEGRGARGAATQGSGCRRRPEKKKKS